MTDTLQRAERPMLARVADHVYWMGRYVERAEHAARLVIVSSNLLTDVGDLAPELQDELWHSVPEVMRLEEPAEDDQPLVRRIGRYMALNELNRGSIVHSIAAARENARAVREIISLEMWEQINTLYWFTRNDDTSTQFEQAPEDFLRTIIRGSMLFQGFSDETLPHDQRWLFLRLGKYFERIDVTSRLLASRYDLLGRDRDQMETSVRNIHWMATLRMCGSLEAYRRQSGVGDFDPEAVCAFVTLQQTHPRAIRHCVEQTLACIAAIRQLNHPNRPDPAEKLLGRLVAKLEYAEPSELFDPSFQVFMSDIQAAIAEASLAMMQTYFLQ